MLDKKAVDQNYVNGCSGKDGKERFFNKPLDNQCEEDAGGFRNRETSTGEC